MFEEKDAGTDAKPAAEHEKGHRVRWIVIAAVGLIVAVASAKAIVKSGKKGPPRPEAVPVSIAAATRQSVPLKTKAVGNVEANSIVSVRALVSGELVKIHFKQGDEVRKGDLLFSIDPRPLESALKQAEGTLAKDAAQAANAEAVSRRYAKLYADGIVSKELDDQYLTAADAQASIVDSDHAAVENAKVQLSYATIRAPLSGTTGNLIVYEGNLVKANDTTPLVTITETSPIFVTFSVPEGELGKINAARSAGTVQVAAALPNDETHPATGELTFVDNTVDMTTGTIKLKATFANRDRKLWPGQFVKVTVTTGVLPDAVVVPAQAVQTGQDGPYLYVVKEDQTAEVRKVQVGPADEAIAVVLRGVSAGEPVVTEGQLRLSPGAHVQAGGEGKEGKEDKGEKGGKGGKPEGRGGGKSDEKKSKKPA